MQQELPEILVVEDSDDDFEATRRALCGAGAADAQITRCRDGALAWADLRRRLADRLPTPALILLDLNTPGMDGRMLLDRVRRDPDLCCIPVVVLTTSDNVVDIDTCYRNGANTYLRKATSWAEFKTAMNVLMAYWFTHAEHPGERRAECERS